MLGRKTDFSNPKNLNEIIQWLMFYTNTDFWSVLADKYRVRTYVKDRIGEKYLIPLLGHWDSVDSIDFSSLPDKFVIKPNNGCYDAVICHNRKTIDYENVRHRLNYSLNHKFGYENAELHYTKIKPCIIAEKLLESNAPGGLIDYKVWCFNGEPHCIFVCANRDNIHHTTNFVCYDLNWKKLNYITDNYRSAFECPRPDNLAEMLYVASVLAVGLPQVRVDLYNINGRIYFGEMTLSSNFGMMPYFTDDALKTMGELIELPQRPFAEKFSTFLHRWLPNL